MVDASNTVERWPDKYVPAPDATQVEQSAFEAAELSVSTYDTTLTMVSEAASKATRLIRQGIMGIRVAVESTTDQEAMEIVKNTLQRVVASVAIQSYKRGYAAGLTADLHKDDIEGEQ